MANGVNNNKISPVGGNRTGQPIQLPSSARFSTNSPRLMANSTNWRESVTASILSLQGVQQSVKPDLMNMGIYHQTLDGSDSLSPRDPVYGDVHRVISGGKNIFLDENWEQVVANEPQIGLEYFLDKCVFGPAKAVLEEAAYQKGRLVLHLVFENPFVAKRVLESKVFNKDFKVSEVRLNPLDFGKSRISRFILLVLRLITKEYFRRALHDRNKARTEFKKDIHAQMAARDGFAIKANDRLFSLQPEDMRSAEERIELIKKNEETMKKVNEMFFNRLPLPEGWNEFLSEIFFDILKFARKADSKFSMGIESAEVTAELKYQPYNGE